MGTQTQFRKAWACRYIHVQFLWAPGCYNVTVLIPSLWILVVMDFSAAQLTFSCTLAKNILFRLYMGKTPGWWLTLFLPSSNLRLVC